MSTRRLRLELRPSWPAAGAIVALHSVAAGCAALALPPMPGALLGAALAGLGLLAARSRALLASPSSVRVLELEGARAAVTLASGETIEAEAGGRRHVGPLFVTLSLRAPVRRTILITRDMLDAGSFRRLRVWALWGRLAVAAKQLPARA